MHLLPVSYFNLLILCKIRKNWQNPVKIYSCWWFFDLWFSFHSHMCYVPHVFPLWFCTITFFLSRFDKFWWHVCLNVNQYENKFSILEKTSMIYKNKEPSRLISLPKNPASLVLNQKSFYCFSMISKIYMLWMASMDSSHNLIYSAIHIYTH